MLHQRTGNGPCAPVHAADSIRLDTEAVPAAQRVDYWRSLYESFAELQIDPGRRRGFFARSEIWQVGPLTIVDAHGSDLVFQRSEAHCASADSDHIVFRVSESARWISATDDQEECIGPGELFVRRLVKPSLTKVRCGRYTLMFMPVAANPELAAALSRTTQGRQTSPGARMLSDVLLGLPDRLRTTARDEIEPFAQTLVALIATCLLSRPTFHGPAAVGLQARAKERVECVIRENLGSALLDVNRISRLSGVSRTTLYRLFDGEGGVANAVREKRLRAVVEDFANPALADIPIARIAEHRGLYNATSFSRAFRRHFGCSPSEARAAALSDAGQ